MIFSLISTLRISLISTLRINLISILRISSISTNKSGLETNADDKIQMREMIAIVENQTIYENEIERNMMTILTSKEKFFFYYFRLFTLSELYVTFINRYWEESSSWSSMILVETSRYVWTVSKIRVETSQSSDRVMLNNFSKIEKKKIINCLNFFVFWINKWVIEENVLNSRRIQRFFTVW
jgi:hypothetical protein